MIFQTDLSEDDATVREAAVFVAEAIARINARQFARAAGAKEALPCCARCAGCELDVHAPVRDSRRLLATLAAHPASIVAYSMGKDLCAGVDCRALVLDGDRLAYQRGDGEVIDPVSEFETNEECCCGKS